VFEGVALAVHTLHGQFDGGGVGVTVGGDVGGPDVGVRVGVAVTAVVLKTTSTQ
jgi:hypothetical protein